MVKYFLFTARRESYSNAEIKFFEFHNEHSFGRCIHVHDVSLHLYHLHFMLRCVIISNWEKYDWIGCACGTVIGIVTPGVILTLTTNLSQTHNYQYSGPIFSHIYDFANSI